MFRSFVTGVNSNPQRKAETAEMAPLLKEEEKEERKYAVLSSQNAAKEDAAQEDAANGSREDAAEENSAENDHDGTSTTSDRFSTLLVLLIALHAFFSFVFLGVRDAVILWSGTDAGSGGLGMTPAQLGAISGFVNLPIIVFTLFVVPVIVDKIGFRKR